MIRKTGFSLKTLIISSIIITGVLTEIIVFLTSIYYKEFALESQTKALEEILSLQSADVIKKLESHTQDLGQSLQQNATFKNALASQDLPTMAAMLESQYRQYFVTAGVLKLNNLRVLDRDLNYILHINAPELNSALYRDARCGDLISRAKQRSGAQRLKTITDLCLIGNELHSGMLIPLGGLFINGYLEILTDPAYSMQILETALGLPLNILDVRHGICYQSSNWPTGSNASGGIIATLPLITSDNTKGLTISIYQPIDELEQSITQTRNTVLLLALTGTISFMLIILLILRRYTFNPLQQLESGLRTISLEHGHLGETLQVQGTDEIRALTRGFNDMICALKDSYSKLDAANRELVQHRDHLEELVIQRTSDLEQARDDALQASRTKSQFLANMSHELRTPLNAIIGYSEIVMEDLDPQTQGDNLEDIRKIHNSGRHLLELINDVLDLSKIEAGRMDLLIEPLDVKQLVTSLKSTIHPLVLKNDNRLETICPENIGWIYADGTKLRQALLNLLSNAAKFTQHGIIKLDILRYDELGTEFISFAVSDNGIGISPDRQNKLFQAFSQGDASTTRRYGGTGLGLVLSQHFCKMMGGDISVQSAEGAGSTFTIFLPANVPTELAAQTHTLAHYDTPRMDSGNRSNDGPNDTGSTLSPAQKQIHILIIDDDPDICDLMQRHLEKSNIKISIANTGTHGLALAKQGLPDAIILDILMPDIDGWTVLSQLKLDPNLQRIPVILVSMLDDRKTGYALGANEYITKPVDKSHLLAVISRLVKKNNDKPILVVEDDPDIRSMVVRILEHEGWPTATAENGRAALSLISNTLPALILLDLMMPEMDGFEFIATMRKKPQWQNIPVIVLTAMELTAKERLSLRDGTQYVIRKGAYSTQELLSLVESTIDRFTPLSDG